MKSKEFNIYKILEDLEKRKGLYLGMYYNFDSLDSFIQGFLLAARPRQLTAEGYPDFVLFNTWIVGHLKKHFGQPGGWHWQIRNRNINNDDKAFQEFFQFLDKFKRAKVKRKKIVVDKDAIAYSMHGHVKKFKIINGKQILVTKKPVEIIWTTTSNSTTVWVDYLNKNKQVTDGFWEINSKEARKRLRNEFGKFKNKWKNV